MAESGGQPSILSAAHTHCYSLLLEFSCANGRRCGLGTFAIKTDSDGPAIASDRVKRTSIGWDRRLDTDNIVIVIHNDEAQDHRSPIKAQIKTIPNTIQ